MLVGDVKRAVFLDRDGVLNHAVIRGGKPYPPLLLADLVVVEEAPACLRRLRELDFALIVATNQPDVANGKQERDVVEAMNDQLRALMPIDDVLVCYHRDSDDCACRKPKPGMLTEAAARHGIDLSASYMIGDRYRDVDAGQAAGCRTIWIDRGYAEPGPRWPADARVASIGEATEWIVRTELLQRSKGT